MDNFHHCLYYSLEEFSDRARRFSQCKKNSLAFSGNNFTMKRVAITFQLVSLCLLCSLETATSQNNRLWLEIGAELFLVEPDGMYTWKQALTECKREHSNLINPKGDYDYAKLKDVIRHNFKNYSSFWTNTQVKWTNIFHHIGLGKEQHNRQKCNKFDNSTNFKFLPDNCDNQFGFICEKPLLQGHSSFNTKTAMYFVQPEQEFTCEEAYDQCENRHMSLVVLKDHAQNKVLKGFLFINYGSGVNFWFGYNNETHYNCAAHTRGHQLKYNSRLGFICQRAQLQNHAMSMRHMILLIFVATAAFVAAIAFVILKCFCWRKHEENCDVPEAYFSDDVKDFNIK